MLEHGDARDVEGFGIAAGSVIERNAREVALNVARNPVAEVLVDTPRPFSDEAHLGVRRAGGERQQQPTG
jgi:hypothetical protein